MSDDTAPVHSNDLVSERLAEIEHITDASKKVKSLVELASQMLPRYLQGEFDKLMHDALQTAILPSALTLDDMTHEIFNLIRSFSFVGEIGEDPEDYRISGTTVDAPSMGASTPTGLENY